MLRVSSGVGRRAAVELLPRGQLSVCYAKRYVPPNKLRKATSERGVNRKKSEPIAGGDELLRELNNGGAGVLRDEEEDDWGLDDVAEHARVRGQRRRQRFGDEDPTTTTSSRSSAAEEPSAAVVAGQVRQRRQAGGADPETHGSPLEAGLARVAAKRSKVGEDSAGAGRYGGPDASAPVRQRLGSGGDAGLSSAGPNTIELEVSYARRNREVIEALKRQGIAVRVRQPDGDEDGEDGQQHHMDGNPEYSDLDLDDGFISSEDDVFASDLAVEEDRPGGSTAGGTGTGGTDWYSSLAAAGFSVRTNAAGEVFLERTVRRKAAAAGGATKDSRAISRTAVSVAAAAAAAPVPAAGPVVPPLEPMFGLPAITAALEVLTSPRQVLDFLELSYPQWAANGYRLVHVETGRPVAAPSPDEAAMCLRALALTAHRSEVGAWQRFDLAAGRQGQGLAECLRVTPPRLLPEQATQQLTAAYFDVARRYWLDPAADPIIDDPRVGKPAAAVAAASTAVTANKTAGTSSSSPSPGAAAAAPTMSASTASALRPGTATYDAEYDNLLAKYTALSQHKQLLDMAKNRQQGQQPQQAPQAKQAPQAQQQQGGAQQDKPPLLNGHAAPPGTAAGRPTGLHVQDTELAAPLAAVTTAAAAAAAADGEGAAAAAAAVAAASDAAARRAAKVECLVAALWAMSNLGGPAYFLAETEAAVSILVRCLAGSASKAPTVPAADRTAPHLPVGLTGWQAGQVMWALGNSRHATPRLPDLEAIMLRSGGLSSMTPRDIARVLWGFSSLGCRPERLLLTLRPNWQWQDVGAAAGEADAEKAKRRRQRGRGKGRDEDRGPRGDVRSFSPAQLACVVWSLAVMEQVDTVPFRSAWAQLLSRAAEVPRTDAVLVQTWQANLAVHLESAAAAASATSTTPAAGADAAASSSKKAAEVDLTKAGVAAAAAAMAAGTASAPSRASSVLDVSTARSFLLRARDVFLASTSGLRRRVQSGYQRQIANTLTSLKLLHLLEDNSAGYSVDITLPQLRIAIEADGPTHLSRTPSASVLGATSMKRRHLQRMGWHVINITYKEWDRLSSDTARRAFVQDRINDALLSGVEMGEEEAAAALKGGHK